MYVMYCVCMCAFIMHKHVLVHAHKPALNAFPGFLTGWFMSLSSWLLAALPLT